MEIRETKKKTWKKRFLVTRSMVRFTKATC